MEKKDRTHMNAQELSAYVDNLVNTWLSQDVNDEKDNEIVQLANSHNIDELERRLCQRIQFGTAGLRGKMEAGYSGMNEVTVYQASLGLADYLIANVENALSRGIVVGHDHRHRSDKFAETAGSAFLVKGFNVYFLEMVHTPLVPFAVDTLKAAGGIMITASHNPAADNGYKVYWANGCQIIPPHDEGIAHCIEQNFVPVLDIRNDTSRYMILMKRIRRQIVGDLTDKYFDSLKRKLHDKTITAKLSSKFVYTPMHGVGLPYMQRVVKELGVANCMIVVDEQSHPDPDFPTVKFPNPEEKGALDLAIATANRYGANMILANDPDADRFAVAARDIKTGEWHQLTGNQVGALFAVYSVEKYKRERRNVQSLAMLNSTVSSQLLRGLADLERFRYEDTLTGFKWIGNRAIDLEKEGYTVPFAYEEALGYMFSVVHDKDGISAAYVFLQILMVWEHDSINVLDVLERIYEKVGFYEENNSYYVSSSPELTNLVFESIRNSSGDAPFPDAIGPFTITSWRDLTVGYDSATRDNVPLLPVSKSSQMITCTAVDSAGINVRFTLRGSGTEPKLKVYIEARADNRQCARATADLMRDVLKREWFKPKETGLTLP